MVISLGVTKETETNMDKGRNLQKINEGPHAYHFEYTNIHNQRIALVRLIHLWHQIGFPASILVYGFFFGYGDSQSIIYFPFIGAILSTLIIYFMRKYALNLDQSVIMLYPRIIALELILDYHFYRNYLRIKGAEKKKSEEKTFIEKCEGIKAENTDEVWEQVKRCFEKASFPAHQRGHGILKKAAWCIGVSFWAIAGIDVLFKRGVF